MMGWVILVALMLAAFGAARLLGVPRDLGAFVGAALMLGAAGYALQGRRGLPASPATPTAETLEVDPALSDLRLRMFGRHTTAESLFYASDALMRSGLPRTAISLLLGGVNSNPEDSAVWTALGGAYAMHDGGMSPAARFAFQRALRLAPKHPGPPFFFGAALVRAGAFREARGWWMRAFLLSPDATYRADISERLARLDRFLASEAGRER